MAEDQSAADCAAPGAGGPAARWRSVWWVLIPPDRRTTGRAMPRAQSGTQRRGQQQLHRDPRAGGARLPACLSPCRVADASLFMRRSGRARPELRCLNWEGEPHRDITPQMRSTKGGGTSLLLRPPYRATAPDSTQRVADGAPRACNPASNGGITSSCCPAAATSRGRVRTSVGTTP